MLPRLLLAWAMLATLLLQEVSAAGGGGRGPPEVGRGLALLKWARFAGLDGASLLEEDDNLQEVIRPRRRAGRIQGNEIVSVLSFSRHQL